MNALLIKLASAFVAALAFSTSFAQANSSDNRIVVAADSSSGTYSKMLGEIIRVCSTEDFNISAAKGVTGGAVGNLDALVNNKVQAAFLHSDVLVGLIQVDPAYKAYQTLVALYPEPIHVLALRVSKTSKRGMTSFGKQDFNSLADVKGYSVGAAGGSVYTARILAGQGQGGFAVEALNSGDEVMKALDAGQIAAAIFVGAVPLPNLEKLPKGDYKLIPIGQSIADHVKRVYRPSSVNYPGMTSGPLPTLAPIATIMTRKYATDTRVAVQRHFRDCVRKQLGVLKDTGSPNWNSVEEDSHGVLDWLEIPPAPVDSTPAKPAKK